MMRFSRTRLMMTTAGAALLMAPSLGLAQEGSGAPAGFAVEIGTDADPYLGLRIGTRVFGPATEPAASFVRGCQGHVIPEGAGAAFEVTSPREALAFTAAGDGLVGMVLGTPDGLYRCALADDRGLVSTALASVATGRYTVWLGAAEGSQIDARLFASNTPISGMELFGLDVARLGAPRNGTHVYGASVEAGRQTLVAAAQLHADTDMRPLRPEACWGYSNFDAADAVLTVPEGAGPFSLFAMSDRDLVMGVVDPAGNVTCNDDARDLNPALSFDGALPGDYQIFVGGYGQGEGSVFDLYASAGGAAFTNVTVNLEGTPRAGTVAFDADAAGLQGQLLATAALGNTTEPMESLPIGAYCPGFTDVTAPDLVMSLDSARPMLSLYARSQEDLVMAVRAPDGSWSCNDDAFELNPGISLSDAQPGDYLVFLGTYAPEVAATYNLYASMGEPVWDQTSPGGGFMAPDELNVAAEPAVAELTFGLDTRIDPRIIFDIQPSQTEAFGMGDNCAGFITPGQPDLVVDTTEGLPQLMIYMVSDADGTLVVAGPDGRLHCNDDFEQLHPGVMIPNPQPGRYAVFAGSYSGTGGMATLGVTIASPHWVMDREH